MIRFYMDEHVHGAVTRALRARGVDVLTSQEDAATGAEDPSLLDRASELGRVLVTQDNDLLREAAFRQRHGLAFRGVIYSHQGALTVAQLIEQLELVAVASHAGELDGDVRWLPLS